MNIALCRFLHNHGNIATEGRVLYSAQYHRQHCTRHAFEQFGALYRHNHDDNLYPSQPGFEPGTPKLQAPVDTNEPSRPALKRLRKNNTIYVITVENMNENCFKYF